MFDFLIPNLIADALDILDMSKNFSSLFDSIRFTDFFFFFFWCALQGLFFLQL